MKLICIRAQLTGTYGTVLHGQQFECPDDVARELLVNGLARKAEPPKVLYETGVVTPETPAVHIETPAAIPEAPKPSIETKEATAPEVSPRRPFVTCLCLTRNRREWLPQAIRCYQRQRYPWRELLIVADGADVRDLVPMGDPTIRLIHLAETVEIGGKRNYGCSQARGEVIVHWDDDDFSATGRVSSQVEALLQSGRQVTGFRSMRFTDGSIWWRFDYRSKPYALGTSLCYWKSWWTRHPFDTVQVGEDQRFCEVAEREQAFLVQDAGDLMYATIHPQNTSPRETGGSAWKKIETVEAVGIGAM